MEELFSQCSFPDLFAFRHLAPNHYAYTEWGIKISHFSKRHCAGWEVGVVSRGWLASTASTSTFVSTKGRQLGRAEWKLGGPSDIFRLALVVTSHSSQQMAWVPSTTHASDFDQSQTCISIYEFACVPNVLHVSSLGFWKEGKRVNSVLRLKINNLNAVINPIFPLRRLFGAHHFAGSWLRLLCFVLFESLTSPM